MTLRKYNEYLNERVQYQTDCPLACLGGIKEFLQVSPISYFDDLVYLCLEPLNQCETQ